MRGSLFKGCSTFVGDDEKGLGVDSGDGSQHRKFNLVNATKLPIYIWLK